MTDRRRREWFFAYGALLLSAVNAVLFFAWGDVVNLVAAALGLFCSAVFALGAIYLRE